MHLERLPNVCVLHGDAAVILTERVPSESVDQIFINHPEPPERTSGTDDCQGQHLLSAAFFVDMERILKSAGTITLVSDNLPYTLSLAQTVSSSTQLSSVDLAANRSQRAGRVAVYTGEPPSHATGASSYFDRLWRNGHKTQRYFLYLRNR